jgi:anti-sigma factor RsiW
MNCAEWEERVALYAGGDLAEEEASRVERHLGECAGCRVLASGIRQTLETLREAHADLPLEAAFGAVRARVMERAAVRRRFGWACGFAGAAAAALAVVLLVGAERQPAPPPPLALVRVPAAPPEAFVIPKRAKPVVRPAAEARARTEPLLIKLVTDNPDVVIYWIAETKGY